jgi:hypothetical protein
MITFRVVDCRSTIIDPKEIVVARAHSPEDAAFQALGETLVRSGRRSELRARVYFQHPNQPMSMVRLYAMTMDRVSPASRSVSAYF